jgi:hypothetical protein
MQRGVVMLLGVLAVLVTVIGTGLAHADSSVASEQARVAQASLAGGEVQQASESLDSFGALHAGSAAGVLLLGIATVAVASRRRAVHELPE